MAVNTNIYTDWLNSNTSTGTIRSNRSTWSTLASDPTPIIYCDLSSIMELADRLAQKAAINDETFEEVIESLKKSFERHGVLPEIDQEEFMKLLF